MPARAIFAAAMLLAAPDTSAADDPLLKEAIELPAAVLFLDSGVPGLVLGVIKDGETAVVGFGETAEGSGKTPDGDTLMRIGSITKVFTGATLASLAADGTVAFSDPLQEHLDWGITVPSRDGHVIRLIDLVTHTSGLAREVERESGPPGDPFATLTEEAYAKALAGELAAFSARHRRPLFELRLRRARRRPRQRRRQALCRRAQGARVDPSGLKDTVLNLRPGDEDR